VDSPPEINSSRAPAPRRRLLVATTIAGVVSLLLLAVADNTLPDASWARRQVLTAVTAVLVAACGVLLLANVPIRQARAYRWIKRGLVVLTAVAAIANLRYYWVNAQDAGMRGHFGANMRMFGASLRQYAADNGGDFPPSLIALAKRDDWPAQAMKSPSVEMRCPYLQYVTGLRQDDPADWILLYEDPANHMGAAGYILYVSGTVEFVREPQHSAELRRLGEQYEAARGAPPVIVEQKP
jgi:hypothetical protein